MASTNAPETTLTRAEEAYAHLASFKRGDVVDVAGDEFFQPGIVDQAQQHDGDDIASAYVLVTGCGTTTRVTVASLLDGLTLTLQNEAARGNVRYFDAAGYATQNPQATCAKSGAWVPDENRTGNGVAWCPGCSEWVGITRDAGGHPEYVTH
jgi:hypothetical protein